MLAKFMRRLILPTARNYAKIPPKIRPTRLQRLIPHPASVDVVAMPFFRDAAIHDMRDFVGAFARAGLGVHWPYTVNEALIADPATGRVFAAPDFATHVGNPKNWILGKNVLKDFPGALESECTIAETDYYEAVDRWL